MSRIVTNVKLQFTEQILYKRAQISSFIKIPPVGAELFHADRETDRQTEGHDNANSRFLKLCELA
jgi:hypothetical protein